MEEKLNEMENGRGFFHHNKFHIIEVTEDNVEIKADIDEDSMNPYGIIHGGIIFALGDTAMGMLASRTGRPSVTLDASINYFKKGQGKYLTAKAECLNSTHKICHLRAYIYDENKVLIAAMNSNYYYID